MFPDLRLPVHAGPPELPAQPPGLDPFLCRACRSSRWALALIGTARLPAGAAAGALALLRRRDRVAHSLRLDHVLRHDVLHPVLPGALLPRLGLHPGPFFTGIAACSLLAALFLARRGHATIAAAGARSSAPTSSSARRCTRRALAVWKRIDRAAPGARWRSCRSFSRRFAGWACPTVPVRCTPRSSTSALRARRRRTPQPPARSRRSSGACSDFYPPPDARVGSPVRAARRGRRLLAAARALPDVRSISPSRAFRSRRSTRSPTAAPPSRGRTCASFRGSPGPWRSDAAERPSARPFVYRVRLDAAGRPLDRAFVPSPGSGGGADVARGRGRRRRRRSTPATGARVSASEIPA